MNRLRAVMRRLDPWAALLLGGLLAMGVVILLATPGPWQTVVGKQPPVRLEAPAPDDVALFVMGGRDGSCSGVVWLHLDTAREALTAVVVPPRLSGFSPGDGYAPVGAIAESAGPGAAAAALGGSLGVRMDAWLALDREALDLAVRAMVPMIDVRAARARYREARCAWRGRGGCRNAWKTQYQSLRVALPKVQFEDLGVVAFSNYVLGFGFVRSNLTLEGATSVARALRDVDPNLIEVRAVPVVVERSLGGEVWHADARQVEPLRRSLTMGVRPPEVAHLASVRVRQARVLVIAPRAKSWAKRYAAEVRRRLAHSARADVAVSVVWGADDRLALRAERSLERRPALAAVVAPAAESETAAAALTKVCEMLRQRRQEAVVSGPLPRIDNTLASSARDALQAAIQDCRLPVAWLPSTTTPNEQPRDARARVRGRRAALVAAADDAVQTLVRACWPGALAPTLTSTRLGYAYVVARHTRVGVVAASDDAAAGLLARLRLWGFAAERLKVDVGDWQPPLLGRSVSYKPGSRQAALAIAGDLDLPTGNVIRAVDSPRDVVISMGP